MPERPITVRDVFELPAADAPEEIAPRWQSLREWIAQELNGGKAPSMEEIAARVGELLEIPIAPIFLNSWKKTDTIRELLDESRAEPASILTVELDEHSINSQHRPYIEVRSKKESTKKLEFRLRLIFQLNGFVLKIANGAITEMQPGNCEMRGTLEYQGLIVAEKHPGPISFPEMVELEKPEAATAVAETGAGETAAEAVAPAAIEPAPALSELAAPTIEPVVRETAKRPAQPMEPVFAENLELAFARFEPLVRESTASESVKPVVAETIETVAGDDKSVVDAGVAPDAELETTPATPSVAAAAAGAASGSAREIAVSKSAAESPYESTEVTDSKPDTEEREEFIL